MLMHTVRTPYDEEFPRAVANALAQADNDPSLKDYTTRAIRRAHTLIKSPPEQVEAYFRKLGNEIQA